MKIKLGILVGGNSAERLVSFNSADELLKCINKDKYDICVFEIPDSQTDKGWIFNILKNPPDIIFSALHGGKGENGSVQGLLECMNIPYVGSGVLSSAAAMDKRISKLIMKSCCIPVVDDVFIPAGADILIFEKKINEMGFPVIVKPNRGGSSIGIYIAENHSQLSDAVCAARSFDDEIIIEKFIEGREITCGVIQTKEGLEVLPILDIITTNRFFDYNAKYVDNVTEIDFSTLPEFLRNMIKEIAKKAFTALKCEDYALVDMIVYEEQIYVLEINTLPGLTSHSLIPRTAHVMGISFGDFIDRIIDFKLTGNIN